MSEPASLRDFDRPMLEALVETMLLAAHADGEFSAEERAHFEKKVEELAKKHGGADEMPASARASIQHLADTTPEDRAGMLASIKTRLPTAEARKLAFSLAVELVASDGIVRTSERELLLDMAESLDLDRDEAADLVKAITH